MPVSTYFGIPESCDARCNFNFQHALSSACVDSLQDQLDQSRVLQQHIEQENLKTKHQILVLQEALSDSQQKCQKLEDQFEDYSLASK